MPQEPTAGFGLAAPRWADHDGSLADREVSHGTGQVEVLSDRFRRVVRAEVGLRDGNHWREYIVHGGAVAVCATRPAAAATATDGPVSGDSGAPVAVEDLEVYLLRQYRHPVGGEVWELPAGTLDVPGESLAGAGARELAEEAELGASEWWTLADYHPTNGSSTEAIRVLWARDVHTSLAEGFVREGEEAELVGRWVALPALLEAVVEGRVHNGSTVIGALALDHHLRTGAPLRPADAPFALGPTIDRTDPTVAPPR